MKYSIALYCFLCTLLLVAACDSQEVQMEPGPECIGEVRLQHALQDTSVYVGDAPLSLVLGSDYLAFEHTASKSISYAVESDEAFVEAEIVDQSVQVTASQTGDAQIRVQAVDACEKQAAATFMVHFLDACSPAPPPGEASFLPAQIGDFWTYDYTNLSRVTAGWVDVVADTGRVQLTAIASSCGEGQHVVTLQQEVQIDRTISTEGRARDTTYVTQIEEMQEIQLIEYADGRVLHPFATEPFMRFHPAASDTVQVHGGRARLREEETCNGAGTINLTLTQEQGIVEAAFSRCLGSVAVSNKGRLKLVGSGNKE